MMSNALMRSLEGKILCSSIKKNSFGYVKLHGFRGNPLCDFKDWERYYLQKYSYFISNSF